MTKSNAPSLVLVFAATGGTLQWPDVIDSEATMNQLLDAGYEAFTLDWFGQFKVELCVEDDILFLLDGCEECRQGCPATQQVFLGDGLLDARVERRGELVHIDSVYTPYLDKRFSEKASHQGPSDEYTLAWKRLAKQVLDLAADPRTNTEA